jgi:hypothetical protein
MSSMNDKHSSAVPVLAAIVMLLTVVLGAYVGAYFWRGAYIDESNSDWAVRVFATAAEARFFRPAAKVESLVMRRQVKTTKPLGP